MKRRFPAGTLLSVAGEIQAKALASGAQKPIPTVLEKVHDGGIAFSVWRLNRPNAPLSGDQAADEKPAYSESAINPFLPYDPRLFVAHITDSHVCLLNKYNVFDRHLIIVTREFERQTKWLTLRDFAALWLCMMEFDGIAFYNGGKTAGASQRHKHLQYVPFIQGADTTELPITPSLEDIRWQNDVGAINAFPFAHAYALLDADLSTPIDQAAAMLFSLYWKLLSACGIVRGEEDTQTQPYNLLATRQWMMIVPRSRESFAGVSINALGFTGSLLVRSCDQLETLRSAGPISALQQVGQPRITASRD